MKGAGRGTKAWGKGTSGRMEERGACTCGSSIILWSTHMCTRSAYSICLCVYIRESRTPACRPQMTPVALLWGCLVSVRIHLHWYRTIPPGGKLFSVLLLVSAPVTWCVVRVRAVRKAVCVCTWDGAWQLQQLV